MKTDNYLNLCLDQAVLSPLRYRHGCIVVKGGKVIGKGFNDFRPGYETGALKTGQLPKHSAPISKPKSEPGSKSESKSKSKSKSKQAASNFVAFETVGANGGGRFVNRALTLHSEMMAINSALASSSTLAASAVSRLKWNFKLSRVPSKSGRLQRKQSVRAYVQRACLTAPGQNVQPGSGSIEDQEWRFEQAACRCDQDAAGGTYQSTAERASESGFKDPEDEREQQERELQGDIWL